MRCTVKQRGHAGKQARLHVLFTTNSSFTRTLDRCCWCCTETPIFAPRSLFLSALTQIFAGAVARTMAPAPFCQLRIAADHRDMQHCPRGLITSWETVEPPLRLFQQLENENQALRAEVMVNVVFQTLAKLQDSLSSKYFTFQSESRDQRIPVRFQCQCQSLVCGFHLCYLGVSWNSAGGGFTGGWWKSICGILTPGWTEEKYVGRLHTQA